VTTSSLALSRFRQAQLWRGECPAPAGGRALESRFPASGATPAGRVALEASVPKGPMVLYGLLGGEFRPGRRGDVQVRVRYVDRALGTGQPFASRVAVASERPVAGLPRSLADAVLAAVPRDVLGPGVLTIDCAAHGAIGSSPAVFGALTRAVVTLLSRGPGQDGEAASLLESTLP
jgi:hypothetical protein